jgi:hypothetical protein
VVKRFGGWTKQTRREHWEHTQELRDNQKNGPITTTHINDTVNEENEETPTYKGKTTFSENEENANE